MKSARLKLLADQNMCTFVYWPCVASLMFVKSSLFPRQKHSCKFDVLFKFKFITSLFFPCIQFEMWRVECRFERTHFVEALFSRVKEIVRYSEVG